MSDQTKIKFPTPLTIHKDIVKQLTYLEKKGENIMAFLGVPLFESIFYLYLIKKYNTKCVLLNDINAPLGRQIGIVITLKLRYTKQEMETITKQLKALVKQLAKCIKTGERIILIPLNYTFGKSGSHANILIYKRNTNLIEHFEPHGGEFMSNSKLQNVATNFMLEFTKLLNAELKEKDRPVEYVNATTVCPYVNGLQTLECFSNLPRGKCEPLGYCVPWSMFFAELCLKNPEMSSTQVLENVYHYLNKSTQVVPNYLKKVIRGYACYIVETINRYLKIFFKPDMTVVDIIHFVKNDKVKYYYISIAINILLNIETVALLDPTYNIKKKLKTTMEEYNAIANGASKERQAMYRKKNYNFLQLYFTKRILQNYEEYEKLGKITESIDTPDEFIQEEKGTVNLLLIKKPKTETAKPKTETAKPKTETAKPKTEKAKPKTETAKPKTVRVKPASAKSKTKKSHSSNDVL